MKFKNTKYDRGFALPTVLIASIVMLIVMLSAVTAVSSIRVALNEQYYNQLAREAAESGLEYALSCIERTSNTAPWSDNGLTLRPNTDCLGATISGASAYVMQGDKIRTSFSIGTVTNEVTGIRIKATATTQLLRASSGAVSRSYTSELVRKTVSSQLIATKSASGWWQVCGILDSKTWCWGDNAEGSLGNGNTTSSNVPVRVLRQAGAMQGKIDTDVTVGKGFACSISSNKLYCWGNNDGGQLGNGTLTSSLVPVPVDTSTGLAGKTLSNLVATDRSMCVIASGDAYCWGNNSFGELGIGNLTRQTRPARVANIGLHAGLPVSQINTTPVAKHVCAIANGNAYCWGRNQFGQLGDNTTTNRNAPTAVYKGGVLSGKTVTSIAVGGDDVPIAHTCVVADSKAYCWGSNTRGQLGRGNTTASTQAVAVSTAGVLSGKNIVSVAAGLAHVCSLATNNAVYCWGGNQAGQLGDNTTTDRTSPVAVLVEAGGLQGKNLQELTAGVNRACIIADASTYCWGRNGNGQIGDGTLVDRRKPTESSFLRQTLPPLTF